MPSEVSQYEITRLQNAHSELEREVRRLADELRTADTRHFNYTCEMEPRLTKWSTILFGMSLAFTLFIVFCARQQHPHAANSETAVEAPASTG